MRLSARTAKSLRAEAQYVNQTRTPSHPEFPGVARIYSAPVYQTRAAFSTEYRRLHGVPKPERVTIKRTAMAVTGHMGREQIVPIEMEMKRYPATIEIERPDGTTVEVAHPRAGQVYHEPRLELVPVTKAISATGPKAVYRKLKRLHKKGLLAAAARFHAPEEAA